MSSSPAFFCEICGAALTPEALSCYACGEAIDFSYITPSEPPTQQKPVTHNLTPQQNSLDNLPPDYVLADRYRIISRIGSGGFGKVYKAKDCMQRNTFVAIKQFNLHALSPKEIIEATDSYNREVMHLSKLKHEYLPQMIDHFTDPGHWYVVMDFIEGETLEDVLKKRRTGRLRLHRVLDIGIALCEVLAYLHSQRPSIIFRDVKPANIMLTPEGRVYLIDFGIARRYTPGQTRDTGPLGSPGFAAPEQYGRAQTTEQTDIYGLGATLQTLLTGKDPLELLITPDAHRFVPRRLQALLQQMLNRTPDDRPKNMAQVRNYLQYVKDTPRDANIRKNALSVGYTLKHALLFLLTFLISVGLYGSLFFLPYLIVQIISIGIYVALGLYSEVQENQASMTAKDARTFLYHHAYTLLRLSLAIAIFFWVLNGSYDSPYWSAYLFLSECLAFMCTSFACYRICMQLFHLHSMARLRRHMPKDHLCQQQMQRY